jgi:hypothetical protein
MKDSDIIKALVDENDRLKACIQDLEQETVELTAAVDDARKRINSARKALEG